MPWSCFLNESGYNVTMVEKVSRVSSPPPSHSAAVVQSQLSGHSQVSAVTAFRSWACGHVPKVMPNSHYTSHTTLIHTHHISPPPAHHSTSSKMRNKAVKQVNGNIKNSILISHWNLGSKKWNNKLNQVQALVDTNKPDILYISEANLDELTPPHEKLIAGYNITLPKTVTKNKTARLVLLTKEDLKFELMDRLMDDIVTSIWIKISGRGGKGMLVCGVYREHQYLNQQSDWSLQPAEQALRWAQFMRQIETARVTNTCHILGDFNLDYNKWTAPDFAHAQMISDSKDTLETGGFHQLVEDVTRSWPGQVDSLIDHIWTNEPGKILQVMNKVRAAGDHNVISVLIRLKGSDSTKLDTRKRSFKNFDPLEYRQRLEMYNWEEIYEISNVDLANDFLESRVVQTLDAICPYKTVQHRAVSKPWLSAETKALMETRDVAREKARVSKEDVDWQLYRVQRNLVNKLVNSDRKKHYSDMYTRHSESNDVSATFKAAKNQAGITKNTSPTYFLSEGKKITDPQSMANIQSRTFEEKTTKLLNDLPPATIDPCAKLLDSLDKWGDRKNSRERFEFKPISRIDTLAILKDLANTTGSANDRIDALSLKHGAQILHGPITHIVNVSIQSSQFASKWKIGKLLPLHKGKGLDPHCPKSYRPISLLPILGKIVEWALQPQILNFMEKSEQMNQNHHSYRKNHSTTTAMLQLSDAIFHGCNVKKITTLVTLDQSSAFDVIRHQTLLRKLELYNFGETARKWISSYLNFRSQYVEIGTRSSTYTNVKSGVPQGSVLGPVLYVIYVNELPSLMDDDDCSNDTHTAAVNGESSLFTDNCDDCGQMPTYADDSTVVLVTQTRFQAQERIVKITERVKTFLTANSLTLNLSKTEIVESMVRQKRARIPGQPPQLTVSKPDGSIKVIIAKDNVRLLGANINKDATWTHQLHLGEKPVLTALRSTLGLLTHIGKFMPKKSKLLLANGLFLSKLTYLLPMWGGLAKKDANKIQVLMNKCARVVLGKSRKTRTRALMEGCQWLYFNELVLYHSLLLMYKIIHIGKPANMRNKLTILPNMRVQIEPGRLKISRTSFKWRTAEAWNDLPDHLLEISKISSFKKSLKKFITDNRKDVTPRRPPDLD